MSKSEPLEAKIAVSPGSPIVGKPLKEIEFPQGVVIGVIVRGEEVVIPGGDDHFEPNDHVIVFTLPEAIGQVERFFA